VRVALLAALTMVATDVLGVVMVQAEARGRGWLAGWCDTAQWLVGIVTTTISVTALQGHSLSAHLWVLGVVSIANLFGTKLGAEIGHRWVKDKTLEERLAALEAHINRG
jgi:hypothetical protein